MTTTDRKLVLTLPASKVAAFLEILKQYEFVKVDKLDEIIQGFIRNAPKDANISDEEIGDLLMESRYGDKIKGA
jgi:hypothetical protein